MPSMCDIGVQYNLLPSPSCPPMTKKGGIVPVVEDVDPFEFTEEEENKTRSSNPLYILGDQHFRKIYCIFIQPFVLLGRKSVASA